MADQQFVSGFPRRRPRRLRDSAALRDMVAETRLAVSDLIAPLFVKEGLDEPVEIVSLPGVFQHSRSSVLDEVARLVGLGVRAVMLFGVPARKDEIGSGAWDPNGIVQVCLADLRAAFGDRVVLMADLCIDEYTSHGHCGVVDTDGYVDNDATLNVYVRAALAQAEAGAHMVAPSGMMDGQVGAIRDALDEAGFPRVGIVAYSAKYASGLYGPFRDAVDVTIVDGGDRAQYQQDFRNANESMVEIAADIAEGADMVMVKPAVSYLDVISRVSGVVEVPLVAYHVSGEYAMIAAASEKGWIDHDTVALEQLTAIKRAGADLIITYLASWFAESVSTRKLPS